MPAIDTTLYVFLCWRGKGGACERRHSQALGHIITQWQYVRTISRVVEERISVVETINRKKKRERDIGCAAILRKR